MKEFLGRNGFGRFMAGELLAVVSQLSTKPTTAVFASYRRVAGFETGSVEAKKAGLQILVLNGNGRGMDQMSKLEIGLTTVAARLTLKESGEPPTPSSAVRHLEAAMRGQELAILETGLDEAKISDSALLCIYAGPSGRQGAVGMVERFKQAHSQGVVVGMSCTCDAAQNFDRTHFDYFVQAPPCGMEKEMASMLTTLINLWPE